MEGSSSGSAVPAKRRGSGTPPKTTPSRKKKKVAGADTPATPSSSVATPGSSKAKPKAGKSKGTPGSGGAGAGPASAGKSPRSKGKGGAAAGAGAGASQYCVCHSSNEGFMVECSDGTGGCGGWFHPECCNLILTEEQRQKSVLKKFKLVCSLCVKLRQKAEKRKSKGKDKDKGGGKATKGKASVSEDGPDSPGSPSGGGGKTPRSPKIKLKLKIPQQQQHQESGGAAAAATANITPKASKTNPGGGSDPSSPIKMPPPSTTATKPSLKRRRSAGSSPAAVAAAMTDAADPAGGRSSGRARSRAKGTGRGRGSGGAAAAQPRARGKKKSGGGAGSSVTDGADGDDSWGEESVDGSEGSELAGAGGGGAGRPSPYGTRDRKGRVKYVEEASDNEDDYLTDDDEDNGVAGGSSKKSRTGSTSGSSFDENRSADYSSSLSASHRGAAAAAAAAAALEAAGGVAAKGPPIAPVCDYVVDKILGRQVFTAEHGEEDGDAGGEGGKEMYLVKWKNLSYIHNSWEMASDLQDPRNPSNRQKLLRYNTKMEQMHGLQWRKVLEEEDREFGLEGAADREYFPADMVEVQRIVTCEVTSTQHEAILRKERHALLSGDLSPSNQDTSKGEESKAAHDGEGRGPGGNSHDPDGGGPHDADDLVLYLVKWRGLPYDQCSWEHFKDIRSASEPILNFWDNCRPDPQEMRKAEAELASGVRTSGKRGGGESKEHNLRVRDFTKLVNSPVFGISAAEEAARADSADSTDGTDDDQRGGTAPRRGQGGLTLRDYQLEGVNWLLWNWWNHRSSILADEMGLGKTIQTVGFLDQLWNHPLTKIRGPFCIVAPLSLVAQWQSEIATWSPDMNVVVYHGNGVSRSILRDKEFWHTEPFVSKDEAKKLKATGRVKFHILITTYEVALKDVRELSRIHWKVLVVDEAHRLKNSDSKLFQELGSLPRDHSLLLTGTPLQNKTEELWALLNFADGKVFGDQQGFKEQFGDLKVSTQVAKLHEMLRPYLLRRVKEDVEKSLPPKEETIVEVSLTPVQRQFYRAIYEKNTQFLFKGARPAHAPSLMNIMMELRKCCNHPFLNRGVEERVLSEIPDELHTRANLHKQLVDASGKMVLLAKLLPRLQAEGHKVLIFSQMVRVLDLIEDFMKGDGDGTSYKYERLDGNTRANMRTAAVERFNRPQFKRFVMLLSTRAGGLGLNLTTADTVIIYDSDWNPHNDLQAQARAHRIGQTKAVMVYRLLSKKTYEMHMFHQASLKLGLDKAVLAHARNEAQQEAEDGDVGDSRGMISTRGTGKLELASEEIDHLLKRGAYDVFQDDDKEGKDFVEASIDDIMKRAATKVTYGNTSTVEKLSTSFSKASFVAKDQGEEVDLDDPDFWKKAIGLVEQAAPEEEEETDFLLGQRNRKQTKIFDPHSTNPGGDPGAGRSAKHKKGNGHGSDFEDFYDSGLSDMEGASRDGRDGRDDEYLLEDGSSSSKKERSKKASKAGKVRPVKPLKDWGTHNRDRLVRSLQLYGFGRWPRIRKEAGATIRSLEDVESFARSYVLQAGVCAREEERILEQKAEEAGDGESKKVVAKEEDSEFVRQAMAAAKAIQDQIANGERTVDIPAVLREDKFVEKLVKQSLAKKALQRLDLLRRVQSMIAKAIETVLHEMPRSERAKYEGIQDMDVQVSALAPHGLARALPLGNVRPKWAAMQAWWDLDCDRDLVIGSFLHGFGAYPKMRQDPCLCFEPKILGSILRDPPKADTGDGAASTGANASSSETPKGALTPADKGADGAEAAAVTTPSPAPGGGGGTTTTSTATKTKIKDILVMGRRASRFLGVFSQPGSTRWVALGRDGDDETYLGSHDTEVGAAKAYDRFARKLYMTLQRQKGVQEPDPTKATTNFTQDGTRRPDVVGDENDINTTLPWHRSSCFHGVVASGDKWTAQIPSGHKQVLVGIYPTEVQAAVAYDDATKAAHLAKTTTAQGTNAAAPSTPSGSASPPSSASTPTANSAPQPSGGNEEDTTPLPQLNFESDTDAQQQLDAIAMFEAGFEPDGSRADPMHVLVPVPGTVHGKEVEELCRLGAMKKTTAGAEVDGDASAPGDGVTGGNPGEAAHKANGQRQVTDGTGESNGILGGAASARGDLSTALASANGTGGSKWTRLKLRGSGTSVGGEWEAQSRKAEQAMMPDVRLLNRLLQFLATSSEAQIWRNGDDHHTRVAVSSASLAKYGGAGAPPGSGSSGGGTSGAGTPSGGKTATPAQRKRSTGSAVKKSKDGAQMKGVPEDLKVGVITDRQENAAVIIVQTWAEGEGAADTPPVEYRSWKNTLSIAMKELPQAAGCVPAKWTFWERKMLCAALLAQGAPSATSDDTIDPAIVRLIQGRDSSTSASSSISDAVTDGGEEGAEGEEGVMKGFNWEAIILRANLSRTADEVALYYLKHFLPLCVELCRPDSVASGASSTKPASSSSPSSPTTPDAHNPQASAESATAAGSTPGAAGGAGAGAADLSFFPDPTRDISEHSPVARGVAYIFLKRQQLLRTMRHFFHSNKDAVQQWARHRQSSNIMHQKEGLPLWWCPWIHDLALMAGCVKHGFMNINAMRGDTTLPLHPAAALEHITRTFLTGSSADDPLPDMPPPATSPPPTPAMASTLTPGVPVVGGVAPASVSHAAAGAPAVGGAAEVPAALPSAVVAPAPAGEAAQASLAVAASDSNAATAALATALSAFTTTAIASAASSGSGGSAAPGDAGVVSGAGAGGAAASASAAGNAVASSAAGAHGNSAAGAHVNANASTAAAASSGEANGSGDKLVPGSMAAAAAAGAAAARAAMIVTRGFDGEDERVLKWAEEASAEFPTRRAAEDRVFRVCVSLSKLMPSSSAVRIRCYNQRGVTP